LQFGKVRVLHSFAHVHPQIFPKRIPKMATPKKTATGRWHVQIEVASVRESGTFDTKREADAWAQRRATELREASRAAPGSTKTLRDALRDYAEKVSPTKRGELWELKRLAAFEGAEHAPLPVAKRLVDVSTADLVLWRDARLKVVQRGTVLREITLLGHVLEIARREWGWIAINPMKDVTRPASPDHREVVITGVQVRRMLRQLGWRGAGKPVRSMTEAVATCMLAALLTGMRAGELCALRWDDVYTDHVRLHTSKTGKGRDVPITNTASKLLASLRGFDPVQVFGLQSQTLDALFRRARDRAGLAGFTFHDTRHTAATRLAQRLHVLDLCRVFGWEKTTRALTYYQPKVGDLAKRMQG
jgi:integrase